MLQIHIFRCIKLIISWRTIHAGRSLHCQVWMNNNIIGNLQQKALRRLLQRRYSETLSTKYTKNDYNSKPPASCLPCYNESIIVNCELRYAFKIFLKPFEDWLHSGQSEIWAMTNMGYDNFESSCTQTCPDLSDSPKGRVGIRRIMLYHILWKMLWVRSVRKTL